MAQLYERFGSCILFDEVFTDELGRLCRAGLIEDDSLSRMIWLRILDGRGVARAEILDAFEVARDIAQRVTASQLVSDPMFFDSAGLPAVGFDYVPGQPLNRVLERSRDEAFPLQPENSLLIVERIAMALGAFDGAEIDGRPFAHGFLHPGMIHLSNDGDAQLAGAGLGAALLGCLDDAGAIGSGRAYLAPEILSGGEPTLRADVYSIGAILFHLLTGTALPADPADREAAQSAARLAWDGEPIPDDIRDILGRSLSTDPDHRQESASAMREEVDQLLYGGAYSPTTFNLALFMDRLFRAEIDADETAVAEERNTDLSPYLIEQQPAEEQVEAVVAAPEAAPAEAAPERSKIGLWVAIGAVAVIAVAAGVFWLTKGGGTAQPPPPPTPTAAEIAARRQAQDDRLRELTQEMVQQMMAEREAEIRDELMARQQRIEELQKRLQQSERRAAESVEAAADEAKTQEALKLEIQQQEEAQRAQQDELENERQQAMDEAAAQAAVTTGAAAATTDPAAAASDQPAAAETVEEPTAVPSPTPAPLVLEPTPAPATPSVKPGDFVPADQLDSEPVVLKSQALEWPRSAARSKGKGVVVIQLTVNASGGVDSVEVLRADHTGWGIPEAALEAAAGYRYKPGRKDGVAVTTHAFVTWRYDFTNQ